MSPGRHRVPDGPDEGGATAARPDTAAGFGAGSVERVASVPLGRLPDARADTGADVARRAEAAGALVVDAVSYARNGRTILDDVSVSANPGTSLAVVGPSGSGKSSLLALMAGLERPDSGVVRRGDDGAPLVTGLILQGYGLVSVLTAAENVEVPLQAGAAGPLERTEVLTRAAAALNSVGLSSVADHLIEELSGGQQQRVAIARALVLRPAVLFADELTAELDHEWKDHVVDLVLSIAHGGGTVVLATHDLQIAARCDRIVRLVDGRVSAA